MQQQQQKLYANTHNFNNNEKKTHPIFVMVEKQIIHWFENEWIKKIFQNLKWKCLALLPYISLSLSLCDIFLGGCAQNEKVIRRNPKISHTHDRFVMVIFLDDGCANNKMFENWKSKPKSLAGSQIEENFFIKSKTNLILSFYTYIQLLTVLWIDITDIRNCIWHDALSLNQIKNVHFNFAPNPVVSLN